MRALKMCLLLLPLTLIAALPAMADNCIAFAGYSCGKSHSGVYLTGTGYNNTASMAVLGSGSFTVGVHNGKVAAGDDLIIIAAAPNGLTGTLDGKSFVSGTSSILEGGSSGAISTTWTDLGITKPSSVQYGYVNLGAFTSGETVNISGVGYGTVLYGVVVNSKGQIVEITSNSSAGYDGTTTTTPEPASLTLLGTGLAGLAGLVRKKLVKS